MNVSILHIADFYFAAAAGGLLVGWCAARFDKKHPALLPECAGGVMLAEIFFCLLPQALLLAGAPVVFPSVMLGMIFAVFLKDVLHRLHPSAFFSAALGLYNFSFGPALAGGIIAGAAVSIKFGICVFALHLPWGAALPKGKKAVFPLLFKIAMAALPILPGTLLGLGAASFSYKLLGSLLSFGSGVMLYAGLCPALPRTQSGLGFMTGIIIGFIISIL